MLLRRLVSLPLLIALSLFASVEVRRAAAQDMPSDRAALDAYIRDYILNNPQVVRDALVKLQASEETANTKRVLGGFKKEIYSAGSPEIGSPQAKISIVEFFDYNCPYCKATYPKIKAFVKANPDVKLVLKDVASLGKDSEAVARIMIAAAKQGSIEALHDALMTMKGKVDEMRAVEAAGKLGLDIERLKKDARTSETGEQLTKTQELATHLNVNITPLYLIGHAGIAGAPEDLEAQLVQSVEDVRKNGCEVC